MKNKSHAHLFCLHVCVFFHNIKEEGGGGGEDKFPQKHSMKCKKIVRAAKVQLLTGQGRDCQ